MTLTGPTRISRADVKITGAEGVEVEMMDTIETLESRTGIVFLDDTKVNVTEHSKLKIDSFVYDPGSGKGKIGLKAALGTVRYASGKIAHNNRQNVNVQTPTASVAVRGTDFSMTVDEMGRSLVILLPAKVNGKLVVGAIDVTTDGGTVSMDKAFQGTFVSSSMAPPSPPVILNIDTGNISNDLILDKPTGVSGNLGTTQKTQKTEEAIHSDFVPPEDEKVIEIIDNSKFVFVDQGSTAVLRNKISGNVIQVNVPASAGATLDYEYTGGKARATHGSGVGVTITIIQK